MRRTCALLTTGLSVDEGGGVYEYKPWLHFVGKVMSSAPSTFTLPTTCF